LCPFLRICCSSQITYFHCCFFLLFLSPHLTPITWTVSTIAVQFLLQRYSPSVNHLRLWVTFWQVSFYYVQTPWTQFKACNPLFSLSFELNMRCHSLSEQGFNIHNFIFDTKPYSYGKETAGATARDITIQVSLMYGILNLGFNTAMCLFWQNAKGTRTIPKATSCKTWNK
jgi:hypothetical protein